MRNPLFVSWKTEKAAFGLDTAITEVFTTIVIVMHRLFGLRLESAACTMIPVGIYGSDPKTDCIAFAMA